MKLTDQQVIAARVYGRMTGDYAEEALATEVLESRAAEERWRSNSRETFDAMVAMRNDINEHIPLPSIDSDLARGPGNDVFCAEVAQGVVTALVAKDTEIERLTKERDDARALQRPSVSSLDEDQAEDAIVNESRSIARLCLDVDDLTDIITDSIDIDWTPRDAAKAIVRAMGGEAT